MGLLLLSCPKCKTALPEALFNQPDLAPCPACTAPVQAEVFPAFFRPAARGREGEAVMIEGESSCFYHPQKKAVLPCEGCGRFLCALCDCELHGQHFCPMCLETGKKKGKIKNLQNERTLYDSIALSLAVLPMLIFYFTVVTAPMALVIAIRYWNTPLSLVRRSRIRYVLAIFISSLQIAGWGVGIYFITLAITKRHG
jgi:hypothetical protein